MTKSTLYHTAATRRASAWAAGLAVIVTLFGSGCHSAPPLPQDAMIPARPVILSPGDTVKLTFSGASDLNQSQKIRTDGKLSLPQIGEGKAEGKSLPQFERELKRQY